MLDPALFKSSARSQRWNADFCQDVIGRIASFALCRRNMLTENTLPDGTVVSPGADLPTLAVRTVELGLDGPSQPLVKGMVQEFVDKLYLPPDHGTLTEFTKSGHAVERHPAINLQSYRVASLVSFDPRNAILCREGEKDAKVAADIRALEQVAERFGLKERIRGTDPLPTKEEKAKAARADKAEAKELAAGVEQVNRIISRDGDGGLTWYHLMTRQAPSYIPPSDRAEMIHYVAFSSPKLCYILSKTWEWARMGERVLIVVVHPITQM